MVDGGFCREQLVKSRRVQVEVQKETLRLNKHACVCRRRLRPHTLHRCQPALFVSALSDAQTKGQRHVVMHVFLRYKGSGFGRFTLLQLSSRAPIPFLLLLLLLLLDRPLLNRTPTHPHPHPQNTVRRQGWMPCTKCPSSDASDPSLRCVE